MGKLDITKKRRKYLHWEDSSADLPISQSDSKGDQRKGFKLRLFW